MLGVGIGGRHPLVQHRSVGQPGQRIRKGPAAQLTLELHPLGDVRHHADIAERCAVLGAQDGRGHLDVDRAAVLAGPAGRDPMIDPPVGQCGEPVGVAVGVHGRVMSAEDLLRLPTEHGLGSRVPQPDLAVQVELDNRHRRLADQGTEPADDAILLRVALHQGRVERRVLDGHAGLRRVHLQQFELLRAGPLPIDRQIDADGGEQAGASGLQRRDQRVKRMPGVLVVAHRTCRDPGGHGVTAGRLAPVVHQQVADLDAVAEPAIPVGPGAALAQQCGPRLLRAGHRDHLEIPVRQHQVDHGHLEAEPVDDAPAHRVQGPLEIEVAVDVADQRVEPTKRRLAGSAQRSVAPPAAHALVHGF